MSFDPSTAVLVEEPTEFDPTTAVPVEEGRLLGQFDPASATPVSRDEEMEMVNRYLSPDYVASSKEEFAQLRKLENELQAEGAIPGDFENAAKAVGGMFVSVLEGASSLAHSPFVSWRRSPATLQTGVGTAALEAMRLGGFVGEIMRGQPTHYVEQTGEFLFKDQTRNPIVLDRLKEQGLTARPATEDDILQYDYQQYIGQKGIDAEVKSLETKTAPTEFVQSLFVGSREETPDLGQASIVSMAADPTTWAPGFAGAKTLGLARGTKLVSSKTAKTLEKAALSTADKIDDVSQGFINRVQDITGLTEETQKKIATGTAAAVGTLGAGGVLLSEADPATKTALTAASAVLPMVFRYGGATLRKVGGAAGEAKIILREAADATNSLDQAARASVLANPSVPQIYKDVLENPTRFRPIESTPARLAADSRLTKQTRAVADRLSNPLIVQGVRNTSAIAGGAAKGTLANAPFAALAYGAGEDDDAANMLVGGAAFGTIGAGINRVAGVRQRRAEQAISDTARFLVDAEVGRMLVDTELNAGDVGRLVQSYSPQQLSQLAAMQGLFRNKVDFVPLGQADYDANVKGNGGEGSAGMFIQAPPGEKARVFINIDAKRDGAVPHELGHALLKSSALESSQAAEIRANVNRRYTQAGVEARATEYARNLIQARADAEAKAKKQQTQPVNITPEMLAAEMESLGQSGLMRGDTDTLDWARDEIFAEEFRTASANLDFASIRRGLPADGSWLGSMEKVLGGHANALSISGIRIDPATGAPIDTPQSLFRDNPILAADKTLVKNLDTYIKNYRQWVNHPEQSKPRGVRISPTGRAEDLLNNPQVTFHDLGNGVRGNEFVFQDASGQVRFRDQKELNAIDAKRKQQALSMVGTKLVPETDQTLGRRKLKDGRRVISGRFLPQKFDFLNGFAPHIRGFARQFEDAATRGESMMASYHAVGTSDSGSYKISRLKAEGQTIKREVLPWGWELSNSGNLKAVLLDLTTFRNNAIRAIQGENTEMRLLFNNDMAQVESTMKQWMDNHRQGLPGETKIGTTKRDIINALVGIQSKDNRTANPFTGKIARPSSAIKQFRLDRLDTAAFTGRTGFHFDYERAKGNLLPEVATPLPDLSRDLPGQASPERIAATAVIDKDGKILSSPLKTHAQLMEESLFNLDKGEFPPTKNFGFVTTEGRFVLQSEAQQIAQQSRQVQSNQPISGEIVSGLEREGLLNPVIDPLDKPVAELNKIMREVGDKMDAGLKLQSYEIRDDLPEFQTQAIDDPVDFANYVESYLAPQFPKEFQSRIKSAAKTITTPRGQAMPDAVPEFDPQAGAFVIDRGDDVSLPVYQQANRGKPAVDNKGEPKFVQTSYDLITAPRITEYSGPGPEDISKPDFKSFAYDITQKGQQQINAAIDSGAVDSAANSVVKFTQDVMQTPEIAAGMGWYSRMRENLLKVLGEDGREILSQLLGATSAKTPVDENFLQAMDAYEGIKAGRYDANRKAYLEMLALEEKGELTNAIVRRNYTGKVRTIADQLSKEARQMKGKKKASHLAEAQKLRDLVKKPQAEWTRKDQFSIMIRATGMTPMRSNGKKFNANSMAVLKVISGKWLDNRDSPKTPNFAGNLSGRTVQATIDVWAARFLRETLYADTGKPWRIQPKSEGAVNNQDFALGQVIMARAAKKLNMNPDDLQAVLWFAEKHRWDNRGWTKNQGAEKSSFDTVFNVFFPKDGKPLTFAEASKIFKKSKQ